MSAAKRTSLADLFKVQDLPPPAQPKHGKRKGKLAATPKTAKQETVPDDGAGESKRPKFKQHTAYLPLAIHEQLRKLAFEENRKMHDYLIEGLDRVFADRGLPAVKDIS